MTTRGLKVMRAGPAQLPEDYRKVSGLHEKSKWTDRYEVLLRHEAELRYRDRTPAQPGDELNPKLRVTVVEMSEWAREALGSEPPSHIMWTQAFNEWLDLMIERNPVHLKYLDIFALCGAKGEMPPLRTEVEHEVTCTLCKALLNEASGYES